jgi:hypothetical protein
MRYVLLLLSVLTFGCANPGVVQLSPDTYMIYREDHAGIFGSLAKLKAGVISDANAFAAQQGKIAIPLTTKEKPVGSGPAQWASFEYQFRVVEEVDPEAQRTALLPRADVVVESKEVVTKHVVTEDRSPEKKDVYAELIKLDDLRNCGILTEEEFQAQKAKLLREP